MRVIDPDPRASAISARALALALCAGSSLLEGFNNQTLGVAAPKLFPAFHLTPGQGSLLFTATTAGLAIGSIFGGRWADRYGRKPLLLISVALFGLCSLMTALSTSLPVLFLARLGTGLGTGGAMPNAMAIAADAAPPRHRLTLVAMVTAALPLGGATAGLLSLGMDAGWSWRSIFFAGGAPSLLLWLAMWRYLPRPESLTATQRAQTERPQTFSAALFGAGRALTTVELWVAFFFLHMILFMLLNWLPSLFIGLGFTHAQGSWSAFWFNLCGAIAGVLLARMQSGPSRQRWSILAYVGIGIALIALALSRSFLLATLAVALAGTFVIGGQLVLYAMAPFYYPPRVRATGAGAAVASGRIGSVAGPLFAGALLSSGATSTTVLIGALPFAALSCAAVLLLARRGYAD